VRAHTHTRAVIYIKQISKTETDVQKKKTASLVVNYFQCPTIAAFEKFCD
jgi:hypothetical protein